MASGRSSGVSSSSQSRVADCRYLHHTSSTVSVARTRITQADRVGLGPQVLGVARSAADLRADEVIFLVVGEVAIGVPVRNDLMAFEVGRMGGGWANFRRIAGYADRLGNRRLSDRRISRPRCQSVVGFARQRSRICDGRKARNRREVRHDLRCGSEGARDGGRSARVLRTTAGGEDNRASQTCNAPQVANPESMGVVGAVLVRPGRCLACSPGLVR
jgi:hypothetical protein